jgi:hypothetical protein
VAEAIKTGIVLVQKYKRHERETAARRLTGYTLGK